MATLSDSVVNSVTTVLTMRRLKIDLVASGNGVPSRGPEKAFPGTHTREDEV